MAGMLSYNEFAPVAVKFAPQSKLIRAWELKGGVSAQVTALEILQSDGQPQKWVVRQHGEVDRKNNPRIAADEFKLLQILQSVGIAAPKPYYLDMSGEILATPYLVIEFVEGETEFAPPDLNDFIRQFATQLTKIHQIACSELDLAFLPEQAKIYAEKFKHRPAKVDESIGEGRIRAVLEKVFPLPPRNQTGLLHGDFWAGNILWQDNRLVAVLDWEDARIGDPLEDFANSRLEILWAFGKEAMEDFSQSYRAMNRLDYSNLPYWDLVAALKPAFKILEWAENATAEKIMRERHAWFVANALQMLESDKA
jgi:aminoglycoside phosphotransferase (APT) family kinase protein